MPSISGECGLRQAVSDVHLTIIGYWTSSPKRSKSWRTSLPDERISSAKMAPSSNPSKGFERAASVYCGNRSAEGLI